MNNNLDVFSKHESKVRSYCRAFPTIFKRAKGSVLYDEYGNEYLDFLCGAGSVNYGHNNPIIKASIMDYIDNDGLIMGLDFHTQAKKEFIKKFNDYILAPRKLAYKMQFTSPTGTSAVESAVKLARKYTKRENVLSFTNGYHGMTGVSLSLTGNKSNRQALSYSSVTRLPFDGYMEEGFDYISYYRKLLSDNSSGIDAPAAIILETVQGEGGINVASVEWLKQIAELAKEFGALLIVDDIQVGCGRTGGFFSFERAGITPDIVCLSKSIGGFGLPMALLLFKDTLDIWGPGEDNGTFRGNNLAFVAACKMLETYWDGFEFEDNVYERGNIIREFTSGLNKSFPELIREVRGIGMMQGIEFFDEGLCALISKCCFKNGLIIERSGERDQVLKIMPPLTIEKEELARGLAIIDASFSEVLAQAQDSTLRSTALENKERVHA